MMAGHRLDHGCFADRCARGRRRHSAPIRCLIRGLDAGGAGLSSRPGPVLAGRPGFVLSAAARHPVHRLVCAPDRLGTPTASRGGRLVPDIGALQRSLYIVISLRFVDLPLSYAHDYVFAHAYDQSNQTMGKWTHDQAIGLLVQLIIIALVIWIPFLLIRRSPKRWWLWSTIALTPVMIVGIVLAPIFISPLFNTFTPLPDRPETQDQDRGRGGARRARPTRRS